MRSFITKRYTVHTAASGCRQDAPFRAVFLSDMHNIRYGEGNAELLREIRQVKPELILISGDMLTAVEQPQMDAAIELMKELTREYLVYYANGNHEYRMRIYPEIYGDAYQTYVDQICSYGVHLLVNHSERLHIHRLNLTIWGLEISKEYFKRFSYPELTEKEVGHALGKPEPGSFHILLAHHPAFFPAYAKWGADLTLSGHYHGCVMRLPGIGGVISPQFRLLPKYNYGRYELDGKQQIVTSGLGTHTIHLRINNPAEMVVIDFVE